MNDERSIIEVYRRSGVDNGAEAVRHWACGFKPGAEVLEIGFERGAIPQLLIDAGLRLYLVENSLTRLSKFKELFPEVPSESSNAKGGMFHSRTFDGVIVCSMKRHMSKPLELERLARIECALRTGGKLLLVFPPQSSMSVDFRTEGWSSPASVAYEAMLRKRGLEVQSDLKDQSGNEYVCAAKHVQAGVPD